MGKAIRRTNRTPTGQPDPNRTGSNRTPTGPQPDPNRTQSEPAGLGQTQADTLEHFFFTQSMRRSVLHFWRGDKQTQS
jgi:hypothetical protein